MLDSSEALSMSGPPGDSGMIEQAELLFAQQQRTDDVTFAHPRMVASVLQEWGAPEDLGRAAVLVSAMPSGTALDFVQYLPPEEAADAADIARLYVSLLEARRRSDIRYLPRQIFETYTRLSKVIVLTALYVAAARQAANEPYAPDCEMLVSHGQLIFAEIAGSRIGAWKLRREISNLVKQCSEPDSYAQACQLYNEQTLNIFGERIREQVITTFKQQAIAAPEIIIKRVLPYKLMRLLSHRRNLRPSDILSFTVLMADESQCYAALSALNKLGKHHDRTTDYIAHPKRNGYRALHTYVSNSFDGQLTFFIQTPDMQLASEWGRLSVWHGGAGILEEDATADKPPNDKIWVFTWAKALELPVGASPVDAAYALSHHTAPFFREATIAGKESPVGADYQLQHNDIIHLHLTERDGPRREWLQFVKTPRARKRLKSQLAKCAAQANVATGDATGQSEEEHPFSRSVIVHANFTQRPIRACNVCKPYPPQEIIANFVANGAITIHRSGCHIVQATDNPVHASWRSGGPRRSTTSLEIRAWDRVGLIADLTKTFRDRHINIARIQVNTFVNGTALIKIAIEHSEESSELHLALIEELEAVNDVVRVTVQPQSMTEVPRRSNPYSLQPSLNLFYGRKEELRRLNAAISRWEQPALVFISGQQRIGKSSLLLHIEAERNRNVRLRDIPLSLTMLTPSGSEGQSNLLQWFVYELETRLRMHAQSLRGDLPVLDRTLVSTEPERSLTIYCKAIQQAFPSHRFIVMIDEFQRVLAYRYGKPLLQVLKDVSNSLQRFSFVFAGSSIFANQPLNTELENLRESCVDIPLGNLERADAKDLICQPVQPYLYEPQVVEQVLYLTQGHPFFIHMLCYEMFDNVLKEHDRHTITDYDLSVAMDRFLQSPAAVAHLLHAVPETKRLLWALAALAQSPDFSVSRSELYTKLEPSYMQAEIEQKVNALIAHNIVDVVLPDKTRLAFHLPLFRRWVAFNLDFDEQ